MPRFSFEDIRVLSIYQWRILSRVAAIEDLESFERNVSIIRSGKSENISSLIADIATRKDSLTYGTPYDAQSVAEAALVAKYGLPSLLEAEGLMFQELPQEDKD